MEHIVKKSTVLVTSMLLAQAAFANAPWSSDRQWLFGDWNGNRPQLEQQGYKFNVSFINESAANLDGGYNDDSEILHASQLMFGTQLDLEKIAGWNETQSSISITKRDGQSLSTERISDPRAGQLSSVQSIYGRGQSWRLNQAWIKKAFLDHAVQFKIGRMGLSEDFNGSHCEFQNLMLCGSQLGKTVGGIWYNGPVSQWGVNIKYQFAPEWSIATGIYEINPENSLENRGFNLSMDETQGVLIPIELTWKPKLDVFHGLSGEYKIGIFYANANASDVKTDENGEIALEASARKVHHHKSSIWLNAQQQLTAKVDQPNQGLFTSANFTYNDKATTAIESTQQIAFWYKGFFNNRPNDSVGLGFARFDVNERVRDRQNYSNDVNGLTGADYTNSFYTPIQNDELNIELNYVYHWSSAIMLRPNIQYVHQAGGVKQVDDAWIAGLSMRVNY